MTSDITCLQRATDPGLSTGTICTQLNGRKYKILWRLHCPIFIICFVKGKGEDLETCTAAIDLWGSCDTKCKTPIWPVQYLACQKSTGVCKVTFCKQSSSLLCFYWGLDKVLEISNLHFLYYTIYLADFLRHYFVWLFLMKYKGNWWISYVNDGEMCQIIKAAFCFYCRNAFNCWTRRHGLHNLLQRRLVKGAPLIFLKI